MLELATCRPPAGHRRTAWQNPANWGRSDLTSHEASSGSVDERAHLSSRHAGDRNERLHERHAALLRGLRAVESRSEFWIFVAVLLHHRDHRGLLSMRACSDRGLAQRPGTVSTIVTLVHFVPSIAVGIRRLHDTDRSGWWFLIGLHPADRLHLADRALLLRRHARQRTASARGRHRHLRSPGMNDANPGFTVDRSPDCAYASARATDLARSASRPSPQPACRSPATSSPRRQGAAPAGRRGR